MARVQAGRRLLGSVDRLVAPSQHVVTLLEREGVPPGRISHVPYGVPRGEPGRRDRSGRRPLVLGYIGSIKRHKGLDELCQAVHDLPARLRVRLEIHGDPERDAAYGHYLRHRTANEPRIRFMGPFEPRELPDVLRRLDLLLVPSTWPETGPQVALEALAGGVPVLASRIGGLEEVVRPGVHGFLVPPGDPDELGAELRRVAEEPGVLDRLRWRPDEIPDEAACAERMDEAYRRCVGR